MKRLPWRFVIPLALGLVPLQAWAQYAALDSAVTVGSSAAQCVPQGSRSALSIANVTSGTNVIWWCRASLNSTCTPAANTAGSWPLYPGQVIAWPYGQAPTNPFYCIATSPTAMTVGVQ